MCWRFVDLQTSPSESLRSSKFFMCFSIVYLAYWTVASVWAQLCWSGHLPEALQVGKCQRRLTSCFWYLIGLCVNRRAYCKWSACNSEGFAKQTKLLRLRSDFVSLLDASKQGHFLHPRGQANAVFKGEGIEVQKHATNIYYCSYLYILRDLEMRCVFWRMRIVLLGLGSSFHASLLRYAILVEPDS